MPASRQRSRSPFIAWAVRAMINWCLPVFFSFSRISGRRFKTAHFRHLDVHQDCIKVTFLQSRQSFPAVAGDNDTVPFLLKKSNRQLLVDEVVFCQQNPQRSARCRCRGCFRLARCRMHPSPGALSLVCRIGLQTEKHFPFPVRSPPKYCLP